MNLTDPIADLLTRLRNAMRAGHEKAEIPSSRQKAAILAVLEREGYIAAVKSASGKSAGQIQVRLKYDADGEPIINGMRRVSRPGRRVYRPAGKLTPVLGGLGMAVVSTSRGFLTDREAREKRVGGEVLFDIW